MIVPELKLLTESVPEFNVTPPVNVLLPERVTVLPDPAVITIAPIPALPPVPLLEIEPEYVEAPVIVKMSGVEELCTPNIKPPDPEMVPVDMLFPFVCRFDDIVRVDGVKTKAPVPDLSICAVPTVTPAVDVETDPVKVSVYPAGMLKVVVLFAFRIHGLVRVVLSSVRARVPPFPVIVPAPTLSAALIDKVPEARVRPPEKVFAPEKV